MALSNEFQHSAHRKTGRECGCHRCSAIDELVSTSAPQYSKCAGTLWEQARSVLIPYIDHPTAPLNDGWTIQHVGLGETLTAIHVCLQSIRRACIKDTLYELCINIVSPFIDNTFIEIALSQGWRLRVRCSNLLSGCTARIHSRRNTDSWL